MLSTLRRFAVVLCLPLALALSGCVAQFQTLQPYTPGEGVNADLGSSIRVRNLLVVADTSGKGVISASLVAYVDDTLTSVTGVAQKADGTTGSALVTTPTGLPLTLPANSLQVLTNPPTRLAVSSPDLKAGLLAQITLNFTKAGPITLVAPVLSSSDPDFEGITIG